MPLEAVRRVGPYEIVSTLGGGSMGEVYVAHDPRLGRNVALKLLAAESLHDPLRRRRFAQEARSASALNHPNIVTIHDFGTMDGISYIVSELVEGQSLRAVIRQGPVPIRQLLEIAVQIASGLAAAHSAGIVHRDLKPENIMITSDGRVKILDFGLAKAIEDSPETLDGEVVGGPTSDGLRTQPGLILGTVGYMSPEQARGMPVSFQTDQFSFGVILHEMATGQQPFRRATPMQTLLEIANLSRLPFTPGPVGFRLVVERCLAREPEQRFGSTGEIQERLQRIRDELPDKPARQAARAPLYARLRHSVDRRTAVRGLWIILVFCLGLVAARLLWPPGAPSLSQYKFTPLAAGGTLELLPAISPNGNTITYAAAGDGVFQIFTRPLKGSLATQLTSGPEDCLFPSWSPDGTRVYYISDDNLWSVGASGGSPELMFENVTRAAVSPDGSTIAMLRNDPPHSVTWSLWYSRSGGAPVRYESGPLRGKRFLGPSYLAFSPDGSKLGVWGSSPSGGSEFWLIPWPTGQPRRHLEELPQTPEARMFAWMPDSRHIVFSDDHLWLANITNGRREQITTGTGHEEAPAVVPGGKVIAFASTVHGYGLREIPLSGDGALAAAGPGWQASPAWSPVRDEYAYVSSASGAPEIWLKDAQSGWQRRIIGSREFPSRTFSLEDVSFAPDGQRIAYARSGEDSEAIWISPLSGEAPVRIAREPSGVFQRAPTWSPDGNWIAYSTIRNGRYALMKARSDGTGQPLLMREDAGFHPAWSPEGHSLATLAPDGLFVVAADGSSIRHIGSGKWMCATWTRHGSEIFGIRRSDRGELELAVIAPDGANEQMKADLGPYPAGFSYGSVMGSYPVSGASLSPDGKSFLTSMLNTDSSLWLLEGFTK